MSAAPPGPGEPQLGKRRGRSAVLRGTAALAAGAIVLLLIPQLQWANPLCATIVRQPGPAVVLAGSRISSSSQQQQQQQEQAAPLPAGFRFNKVAVVVAFDRFEYFRQVVDGLRQAWGSEEYTLAIFIDGPPEGEEEEDEAAGAAAGGGGGGEEAAAAGAAGRAAAAAAGAAKGGGGAAAGGGRRLRGKDSKSEAGGYNRAGWEAIVSYSLHLQWLARNSPRGAAAGSDNDDSSSSEGSSSGSGGGGTARSGGSFRDVVVDVSPSNLGVWPNKKRAVGGGMALSDFVVVLEDDIVLARDALRWFEWHVTSGLIFRRPELAVATCWSTSFPWHESAVEGHDLLVARELGLLDKYWVDHWAQPWGWATWRRTWDALGANWTGQDIKLARAVQAAGWYETMPLVARCNNIGAVGYHKKGKAVGHVHARALTSASFSGLDRCAYCELPRGNLTAPIAWEPLYKVARLGILRDTKFSNATLDKHAWVLRQFKKGHREPSNWTSSC